MSGLEAREPLHAIVAATLARAWSEQFDLPFRVTEDRWGGAQEWRLHRTLSVYTRPSAERPVRRLVADRFRYTRSRRRLVSRWLRGTAAASLPVQRLGRGDRSLWVSPGVPDADALVVLPGNQRVRIFDTRRGVVRGVTKAGFSDRSLQAELAVRTCGVPGPYLPVLAHRADRGWFDEPLVAGFSLDVCPPWRSYNELMAGAVDRLSAWLEDTRRTADLSAHVEALAAEARRMAEDQLAVGGDIVRRINVVIARLSAPLSDAIGWPFAWTHGDLQPGNVLVPHDGPPVLIDWEFSRPRVREYDGLVHGLQTRRVDGRSARLVRYLRTGRLEPDVGLVGRRTAPERASLLRVLLLEELTVALSEVNAAWGATELPSLRALLHDTETILATHLRA